MLNNTFREKILNLEWLDLTEAMLLWSEASLSELIFLADKIRYKLHPKNEVSWIIDRNVNSTNVCFSQCSFCNFCVKSNSDDAYILGMDDYRKKIDELFELGGKQLLLQGGMNPAISLEYYETLFSDLKSEYPDLKLNALGPPEIVWLSRKAGVSVKSALQRLHYAGLDSLPGAGAEILSDRVRRIVSPAKATTQEWLDTMREAHKLEIPTTATMMFGFIESVKERIEHLIAIRQVQSEKPENSKGFLAFIPWPFQRLNTRLLEEYHDMPEIFASEYLRMIAFSRIMLPNIPNIQASWLTVGQDVGAMALHAGANDLGSIMIEENVVSAAGANFHLSPDEMKKLIHTAGFEPFMRDQNYNKII